MNDLLHTQSFIWSADPVLLNIGFLSLRWYSLLFAFGIFSGLWYGQKRFICDGSTPAEVDALFIKCFLGILIGARLGHVFFYDPGYYLSHPLEIVMIWKGGLASHGAICGILLAAYIHTKKYQRDLLWVFDRVALPSVLGGVFIRLGNLFNSEIYGLPTKSSFGVIFLRVDPIPRHPSQVYEALLYLAIFISGALLAKQFMLHRGRTFGYAVTTAFIGRIALEPYKSEQEAYEQIMGFSTGQWLSIPFVFLGLGFMWYSFRQEKKAAEE